MFDTLILQPVMNLLMTIYNLVPGSDFGIVIIIFTILIQILLYPLVKKQLHQTVVMQKLQPELVKIRKAAKGNKQLEGLQMMELYKKYGVSPFRSIFLLLIRLPIIIALFQVIQIFTNHRDQISKHLYDFVQNMPAVAEVVKDPTHINDKMLGFISLTDAAVGKNGIDIILVLIVIAICFVQFKTMQQTMPANPNAKKLKDIMSEAAQGVEADQMEMNAAVSRGMMKFMPIFIGFIMLPLSGGVVFYYLISALITWAQQSYVLKQDEFELEDIAKKAANKNVAKASKISNSNETSTKVIAKATKKGYKKSSAKARAGRAQEANITRIKAKDK